MKHTAKILVLSVLCVCMLTSAAFCSAVFSAENDTYENYGQTAYDFLKAVGALDESELLYKAEQTVTRAYFIKLALHLSKDAPTILTSDNEIFSDVNEQTEYEAYIETAYRIGYISGYSGGLFNPGDGITFMQAVKILTNILGYSQLAEANGGYPYGYAVIAKNIGLTDGISADSDTALTQNDAMILLYNAANAPLMQIESMGDSVTYTSYEDETLLAKRYGLGTVEGVICATAYTHLAAQQTELEDGQIMIDDTAYDISGTRIDDYLGYNVKLWYNAEDNKAIHKAYYAEIREENNIFECDTRYLRLIGSGFEYDDNNSVAKIKLSPRLTYIVNGKMSAMTDEELVEVDGKVVFISNDGDKSYDAAIVTSYRTYIVSGASATHGIIVANDGTKLYLDPDDDSYVFNIYDANSRETSFRSISENTVILMAESSGEGVNSKKLIVSNTSVSGKVSELGDDYVVVDGETYGLNPFAAALNLTVGRSYKFLIDAFGRVAHVYVDNDIVYGYLYGIKERASVSGKIYCKIFTENNRWVELDFKERFKFNGEVISAGEILGDEYLGSAYSTQRQMIRYNVNSDGEIIMMETAASIPVDSEDAMNAAEVDSFRISYSGSAIWRRTVRSFDGKFFLSPGAKIFVIPANKALEDFEVKSISALEHDRNYSGLVVYDIDEKLTAAMMTISDLPKDESTIEKYLIVNRIGQKLNYDGDVVPAINGWRAGNQLTFPVKVGEGGVTYDEVNSLKSGDVIQFSYDDDGNITKIRKHGSDTSPYYSYDALYALHSVVGGVVTKCNYQDSQITVQYTESGARCGFACSSLVAVYIYDKELNEVTSASVAEITEGDVIIAKMNYLQALEIFVLR